MDDCWQYEAHNRPTFPVLVDRIDRHYKQLAGSSFRARPGSRLVIDIKLMFLNRLLTRYFFDLMESFNGLMPASYKDTKMVEDYVRPTMDEMSYYNTAPQTTPAARQTNGLVIQNESYTTMPTHTLSFDESNW